LLKKLFVLAVDLMPYNAEHLDIFCDAFIDIFCSDTVLKYQPPYGMKLS